MSEQPIGPPFGPFDAPMDTTSPTEYGGKAGWMQSQADGHTPTASEKLSMVNRLGGLEDIDPVTGLPQPVGE